MQPLTEPPALNLPWRPRHSRNGRRSVRVNLRGVHKVRRKLADGSERVHYYAWRGGPKIEAEPGTPDFVRLYTDAHKGRRRPSARSLQGLIGEFRSSAEYAGLSDSTKRAYATYLKLIEERFGDMPTAALADPEARGEFMTWRDEFAEHPRKADYAWTTLARVLSFAKNRGRITVNPCERGGRLYEANRAEKIWQAADIAAFCAVASADLQAAMLLALWTGQRQGDLLRLTWNRYDGTHIRLKQSKSGKRVTIPVGAPLKTALDAAGERPKALTILTNSHGERWTGDGFRASWRKASEKAGIDDLHFHDFRGTAVTRLALAGCTVPEIAALTGHSLKDVEAILDAHYLGGRLELAESAITKLSAVYGAGTNR